MSRPGKGPQEAQSRLRRTPPVLHAAGMGGGGARPGSTGRAAIGGRRRGGGVVGGVVEADAGAGAGEGATHHLDAEAGDATQRVRGRGMTGGGGRAARSTTRTG